MRGTAKPLAIVVAGQVDHGKSTLIGRLLYDTGALAQSKLDALRAASARRGVAVEWSFALDALQVERDQAVTIDATRITLALPGRDLLLIDAPGHREFLAKMVAGATSADAALLVADATAALGEQARSQIRLFSLLGIKEIIIVVNKLDLVGFSEAAFQARRAEILESFAEIGSAPRAIIPVAAREGDNLTRRSRRMPWYEGPSLVATLEQLPSPLSSEAQALRLPIQDVYRIEQRRIFVGRIESGGLSVGDELLFSPSSKTARVAGIELWPSNSLPKAVAGQSIGLTLDRPLFLERGEVASHGVGAPCLSRSFRATLAWLDATPLVERRPYRLQLGTAETSVMIDAVEQVIHRSASSAPSRHALAREEIGAVVLHSPRLLALDDAETLPRTGRFVLRDGANVVACGLVRLAGIADERPAAPVSTNLSPIAHRIPRELRVRRFGHRGGVLWLTGLSGSGKSTLAMALEEHLFRRGVATYVLDGDNLRGGLNADLGFSARDRAENIRRAGEVAALFADAGLICITAFISPYAGDRARARAAAGDAFHEIYLAADLATCEARDPKGLYRRARSGEVAHFTGISAPYEPPGMPELTIDTAGLSIEACLEILVTYVERQFLSRAEVIT